MAKIHDAAFVAPFRWLRETIFAE